MTAGDTVFDATEPQAMWRALVPLERGTYTVVWRNVSTIDGHRVVSSYLFSVGEPLGSGTVVESADQSLLQSPTDPFIRWVAYVAIAAIVGGLMFEMFVVSNLLASPASNTQFERVCSACKRVGNTCDVSARCRASRRATGAAGATGGDHSGLERVRGSFRSLADCLRSRLEARGVRTGC